MAKNTAKKEVVNVEFPAVELEKSAPKRKKQEFEKLPPITKGRS